MAFLSLFPGRAGKWELRERTGTSLGNAGEWIVQGCAGSARADHIQVGALIGVSAPWDDGIFGPVFEAVSRDEAENAIGTGFVQWRVA
jgi:hypothetical protein